MSEHMVESNLDEHLAHHARIVQGLVAETYDEAYMQAVADVLTKTTPATPNPYRSQA